MNFHSRLSARHSIVVLPITSPSRNRGVPSPVITTKTVEWATVTWKKQVNISARVLTVVAQNILVFLQVDYLIACSVSHTQT